jgi:hypothetical protein
MSIKLRNLIVTSTNLTGAAYQVALTLAANAKDNQCSISISDLALDTHLTKNSVLRALQQLCRPYSKGDHRSILKKTRQGRGTGISSTYQMNLELLLDLRRLARNSPSRTADTVSTGNSAAPLKSLSEIEEAGKVSIPVERREIQTLGSQIDQKRVRDSDFLGSAGAMPLSKREVTRRMNAHAKQSALDMIAMMNGSKGIPWMIEQSSEELPEDAVPIHAGDGLSPEAVDKVAPEGHQSCNALIDGRGEQPLFLRGPSLRSGRGSSTPCVVNPSGIRWPRR